VATATLDRVVRPIARRAVSTTTPPNASVHGTLVAVAIAGLSRVCRQQSLSAMIAKVVLTQKKTFEKSLFIF
jgi:hypothetical protein